MATIAAVIVTYNRLNLLKDCIASLREQTVKLSSIIVVNNGSSDGTKEWLQSQTDLQVFHQTNLGGAGGFKRGLEEAFNGIYDWVWIMDDDAFPDKHCLANLLAHKKLSKSNDIVLTPVVVEARQIDHLHRGFIDVNKPKEPMQQLTDQELLHNIEAYLSISFSSFIGMFIGRKVIEKVGYPNDEFFIFHDDVEYSIRICKHNFPIYLVKEAVIFHKTKNVDPNFRTYSSITNNNISNTESHSQFSLKKELKKWSRYSAQAEMDCLRFIGQRNLLRTVLLHSPLNIWMFRFLLRDLFRSLIYLLFARSNKKKLFLYYINVYRQSFTGRFNNKAFFNLK